MSHYIAITHVPLNFFFFFNDTATTEIYTLSLHDALPIYSRGRALELAEFGKNLMRHRDLAPGGCQRAGDRFFMTRIHKRSEEHTSELQSRLHLVCRLLLEKKKRI